jgi:hypothetical protein
MHHTRISFAPFMAFCKTLEGRTLPTVGGQAEFVLAGVTPDTLYCRVVSTDKERRSKRKWIERVLDHHSLTGSLRPGDYVRVTTNASYTLALMDLYLKSPGSTPLDLRDPFGGDAPCLCVHGCRVIARIVIEPFDGP